VADETTKMEIEKKFKKNRNDAPDKKARRLWG
jgi:hypothetical protein